MVSTDDLYNAAALIDPYILRTPITYDPENAIFLKWENQQVTGSFKARGAFNKVLSLPTNDRMRGMVAASAGNHGQGVALAGQLTNSPVIVFCSETAARSKVNAMRSLGAQVREVIGGYGQAEQAGLEFAITSGAIWISPYNDEQVIAGQGTIALEIMRAIGDIPVLTWIVPTGGGGLISGIGITLMSRSQDPLIAVQAEASAFFYSIYKNGSQQGVPDLPTLADGLSGPVQDGAITIPIVSERVDDFILLSEDEIAEGITYAWKMYGQRIEGSAAVGLAAVLSGKVTSRPAAIVISGGNIDTQLFRSITSTNDPIDRSML